MSKSPSNVTPPAIPPPAPPQRLPLNNATLTVLRRQINQQAVINRSIHYLAQNIFKPNTEIKYRLGARDYFGRVLEIVGNPGETQVRVVNLVTGKKRNLRLIDIIGIVQEA